MRYYQIARYHEVQAERWKEGKMRHPPYSFYYDCCQRQEIQHRMLADHYDALTRGKRRQTLLSSLKEGGYILYARHAEATEGEDEPTLDLEDCTTQRNLSDTGRQQAVTYGEILRRLGIPIDEPIMASPFCRTKETAVLAFGEDNVEVDPFWINIYNLSSDLTLEEEDRIMAELTLKLEIPPPEGANTLIIAHGFPPGLGLGEMANMGTIIVKPLGQGMDMKSQLIGP
ncbi:histidine phosphatase family protein [Halobacillus sp. B23F22_1]|uniref:histidine phosphatase family protein n=1 Tax=Halobacillus sp. B23F22_1 TaxID=3459514 RepID=UPI00373FC3DC